jgi:signal peptidase I
MMIVTGLVIFLIVLPLLIRALVVETCHYPATSEDDVVLAGDYFLVNKFIYGLHIPFTNYRIFGFRTPERGDVVVFTYPHDSSKVFIKRIIGLPGEEITIVNKVVTINGRPYRHPLERHTEPDVIPANQNPRDNSEKPVVVPEGTYFVMGDNRDRSWDSRFWGVLADRHIRGRASLVYWSWDDKADKARWDRIGKRVK